MAGEQKKASDPSTVAEEKSINENIIEDNELSEDHNDQADDQTSDVVENKEEESTEDTDNQVEDSHDTTINELQEKIARLEDENKQTYERMLRIQAEFDNYKKRTQREKSAERKYRSQDLATQLLPALDNFERALAIEATEETKSILEGISMVYEQIKEALKSEGIEEIDAVGKEFDPNLHHAVMQVEEEDQDSNIVIEVLQKGYQLKDRVIRPAMVKVNK